MYRKGQAHIIVGEYKDAIDEDNKYLEDLCLKYKDLTYLRVPQKGIAYARNYMITQASKTDIILNFDADSVFNRQDAVEHMVRPILDREKVLTNCECVLFDFENRKVIKEGNIYAVASGVGNYLEKSVFARGPGLTVRKDAFFAVGGFRDVPVAEDYWLAFDVCYRYSYYAKKFIDTVKILTSDRRAKASKDDGLNVFDYQNKTYR